MRIAVNTLFDNPLKPTGSMVFLIKIIEEFARIDRNNNYFILTSFKNRNFFKVNQENILYLNCFVGQEKKYLRLVVAQILIPFMLWKHKIDVYFCPQNISPFFIPNKVKVAVYLYGTHHWHNNIKIGFIKSLYRKFIAYLAKAQADSIIANSSACRNDIITNLNMSEDEVKIISEAYDHKYFNFNPLSESEMNELVSKGIKYKKYILFVSVIYHYKNIHTLISAFIKLNKLFPEYDLVMIGRVDLISAEQKKYYENLVSEITENNISDRVKFLGQIEHDKLNLFYKGAHCYVQPSLYETFGKTVIEAMACGVPVIAANSGATPEIVGTSGLLFDPQSSKDLYNKMKLLIDDKNLYERLITDGLENVKKYTFSNQASSFLQLFEKLMK